VRLAFLHKFSDPDFLWATLDIAIWSTVEQGLAITAGSLATLRPLMRIVTSKLGISTTRSRRPSGYIISGSHPLSRRKGSKGTLDAWTLSNMSSPTNGEKKVGSNAEPIPGGKAKKYENSNFFSPKSAGVSRVTSGNESEEELSPRMPDRVASNEEITVTKTFFISDERC